MSSKIAVATLDGKAYYKIVNMLKEMGIPFSNIIIGEKIESSFNLIITTKKEKSLIKHDRIICIEDISKNPYLAKEKVFTYLNNDVKSTLIIGIDPGKVIGLAFYYGQNVLDSVILDSIDDVINMVSNIIKNSLATKKIVRIGDGNHKLAKEIATNILNKTKYVIDIELVNEKGTTTFFGKKFDKNVAIDQKSAMLIALRKGNKFFH